MVNASRRYTARAYIDGRWVTGEGEPFEVINPATEEVLAVVPASDHGPGGRSRRRRRPCFRRRSVEHGAGPGAQPAAAPAGRPDRAGHRQARSTSWSSEIGTPRAVASFMQVPFPVRNFRWFADAAAGLAAGPDQTLPTTAAGDGTATLLTREPIGVVLGLTAFNFPLNLAAWKIGGALAVRMQHRADVLAQVRPDHHGARRPGRGGRLPAGGVQFRLRSAGGRRAPLRSPRLSTLSRSPARRRSAGGSSS